MRGEFPANTGSLCCLVGIESAFGNTVQRDHDQLPASDSFSNCNHWVVELDQGQCLFSFHVFHFYHYTCPYSSDSDQKLTSPRQRPRFHCLFVIYRLGWSVGLEWALTK